MNELINLLKHVSGGSFGITLCAMPLSWFTIGPHYDKILKRVYNPMNAASHFPRLGRAVQYSALVVLGKGMRKSLDRAIFGEYDFRKDARWIDKLVAYLIWIPFGISCISTLLIFLCWLILKAQAVM